MKKIKPAIIHLNDEIIENNDKSILVENKTVEEEWDLNEN